MVTFGYWMGDFCREWIDKKDRKQNQKTDHKIEMCLWSVRYIMDKRIIGNIDYCKADICKDKDRKWDRKLYIYTTIQD